MSLISSSITTTVPTLIFSYTALLWGFILAAVAVEELPELLQQVERVKHLLAFASTGILLYFISQIYKTDLLLAGIILLSTCFFLAIVLKKQLAKYELFSLLPISIVYCTILFSNLSTNNFLLLCVAIFFYLFLLGITLHAELLGVNQV